MIELNTIYNEDCLSGMNKIPDKSIDMILCDLPYGTTRNKWDSIIPLGLLWEQYERIIKDNGAIVLTAQTPFDKVLGASNLKLLKYEWIWRKNKATGHLNAKKMPMKEHENILVFYKKLPIYNAQGLIKKDKPTIRKGGEAVMEQTMGSLIKMLSKNMETIRKVAWIFLWTLALSILLRSLYPCLNIS